MARRICAAIAAAALLLAPSVVIPSFVAPSAAAPAAGAGPVGCSAPAANSIVCENARPGTPASQWQVSGAGDPSIQGFATEMSVDLGQTETFKIKTPSAAYHVDILRMGYYQGDGARLIAAGIRPVGQLPQRQPECLSDPFSGLFDCGNWQVSASWKVPDDAVSGVYLARLVRDDKRGAASLIPFVVRNDASTSSLLFQTSDETWQAYNTYGGNSLYQCAVLCPEGNPDAYKGAAKVSYNRPFNSAVDDLGRSWIMATEYPMIRFLEENGYDLSYVSAFDVASHGELLTRHKTFLSVGHDEYWSGDQRANVEAARDKGVNLAFFSGNEVFWKTRWETSIDGTKTAGRTLVSYKDTHFNAPTDVEDPNAWTGTWQDPRFSPPADGGRPQNALTGQLFIVNAGTADITVPAQYADLRLWRNTAVASLRPGQSVTLGAGVGTLGYEWDITPDNGFQPPGLIQASSTTVAAPQVFIDYGSTLAPRTETHHLSLYRAASGALVFGAGTVQWSWGLDNATTHKSTDRNMQQATVNLFADMGAQPATPMSGLVTTAGSTDHTAPVSRIDAPAAGATFADGHSVTIRGTASDRGGVVAGVEVSVDAGTSWHPAAGKTSWTYNWNVHGSPSTNIMVRAVDDSGNLEKAHGQGARVTCPCTLWGSGSAPAITDAKDKQSAVLGVQFTSSVFGTVNSLRFYKSKANVGPHVGRVWTSNGTVLATATFEHETASGWQQATLSPPVLITPGTTYIASYYAPSGHYSVTRNELEARSITRGPLIVPRDSPKYANGVFSYGGANTFPNSSFDGDNYYVDVVFSASPSPGQPSHVAATVRDDGVAVVNWRPPKAGGVPTKYVVTPWIGSVAQPATVVQAPADATGRVIPTAAGAPTTAVVRSLPAGQKATFTVRALNPTGEGPKSAVSNPVTLPPRHSWPSWWWVVLALVVAAGGIAGVVLWPRLMQIEGLCRRLTADS